MPGEGGGGGEDVEVVVRYVGDGLAGGGPFCVGDYGWVGWGDEGHGGVG